MSGKRAYAHFLEHVRPQEIENDCFYREFTALKSLYYIKGIVRALQDYQLQLIKHKVTIFVRRGGPNYQEGLRVMREVGKSVHLVC